MIELLVVIAIIALILAILLPSLGAARGTARAAVCQSNTRQIVNLASAYFADHRGAIMGAPTTSGWDAMAGPNGRLEHDGSGSGRRRVIDRKPTFNGVAVQAYDWMGPLVHASGVAAPGDGVQVVEGETHDELRAERFDWYRSSSGFLQCPENTGLATPFPAATEGEVWKAGTMIPYALSTQFTSTKDADPFGTEQRHNDRRDYAPRIDLVGPGSMKAFLFEGHRYARLLAGPDFHHALDAPFGGAFGDTGPWYNRSKALDRTYAPGEPQRALFGSNSFSARDTRALGFRHNRKPKGELYDDVYGVVTFFDGHSEIMSDLEATNPTYWFPTGSKLGGPSEFWESTRARFPNLLTGEAISP
ncbi:MAG: hypothetical protein CMJ31_04955 [Phycisphaerae bacterium]|nr:hypothetical protein [Phycisphaerae bacterium]